MRSASRLIPDMARARSSGREAAPRANSSAYARTAASGVRSSWEASPTNRRSLPSDASRARNADSIWASIALSASPRRPTSVRSSARSTRRVRSPAAIPAAVVSIARRGRRPTRTAQSPSPRSRRGRPRWRGARSRAAGAASRRPRRARSRSPARGRGAAAADSPGRSHVGGEGARGPTRAIPHGASACRSTIKGPLRVRDGRRGDTRAHTRARGRAAAFSASSQAGRTRS
jgi:hypothetical protein